MRTTGARFGPNALRETSVYFGWHANPQFSHPIDIDARRPVGVSEIQTRLFDLGDIPVAGQTREAGDILIRAALQGIASTGASALILGGGADIVAPALDGVGAETPIAPIRIGGYASVPGGRDPVLTVAPRRVAPAEAVPGRGEPGFPIANARQLAGLDADAIGRLARKAAGERLLAIHLDLSALASHWHGASDVPRFDGLALAGLRKVLTGLGRLPVAMLAVTGLNPALNGLAQVKTGQRLLVTALLSYIHARLGASTDRDDGERAA